MTQDPTEATLQRIKDCVARIREKECRDGETTLLWQSCVNILSYMNDLSPASLRNVRLHTEVFTAEHFNFALFNAPNQKPLKYARRGGYIFAIEDLAKEYWISEPPIDGWLIHNGQLGCNYEGRIINAEICRYQLYFENFASTGMISTIRNSPQKSVVMEIGAGYGAIGHHLLKMVPGKVCYVVCDLPLVLLYSGCYLATHHPEARVFIYDPANRAHQNLDEQTLLSYDVVLMPNHHLGLLKNLTRVDYAINTISMSEMTPQHVQGYIDFIKPRLTQYFYFHNYDWNAPQEGVEPLHRFVGKHFDSCPSLEFYHEYARKTGGQVKQTYYRTLFFTANEHAHEALAKCKVKLKLPDRMPVRLALGDDSIEVRTRLGRYRPLSALQLTSATAFTKILPFPRKLKEGVRKELMRGV